MSEFQNEYPRMMIILSPKGSHIPVENPPVEKKTKATCKATWKRIYSRGNLWSG